MGSVEGVVIVGGFEVVFMEWLLEFLSFVYIGFNID